MPEIESGFYALPEGQYLDPLHNPEGEIEYSEKFFEGSIFTEDFIRQERTRAKEQKTIVFDLDGTLRGWDEKEKISFLREAVRPILEKLKEKGYRLIIWSSAIRDSVQQTLNKYPEFEGFWDLIITAENYSFAPGFLPSVEKEKLRQIDPETYKLMNEGSNLNEPEPIPHYYEPLKNISLFGYSLLVEDSPKALDCAAKFGFNCLGLVPYQYRNPHSRVADSLREELKNEFDQDFAQNTAERIITLLERPEEYEKYGLPSQTHGGDFARPEN